MAIGSTHFSNKEPRSTRISRDVEDYEPLRLKEANISGEMKSKESQTLAQYWIECELENKKMFRTTSRQYESKEIETLLNGKSTRHSILKHTRRIGDQQYILLEKKNKGQILSTETITTMTPIEVMEFKEKWRIMWHPEMSEDKILDLVNTKGEPETNTEVEAAEPATQETPDEESRKKQEPEWCVWCVLLGCAVCALFFLNVEVVLILVLLLKKGYLITLTNP